MLKRKEDEIFQIDAIYAQKKTKWLLILFKSGHAMAGNLHSSKDMMGDALYIRDALLS